MKLSFSLMFASMTLVSGKTLRRGLEGHLPAPPEDSFDEPMLLPTTTVDCPETEAATPRKPPAGENPCEGTNPQLPAVACYIDAVEQTGPQSGTNVTEGYNGSRETDSEPIDTPYWQAGLCPVNVHWHLGTEHLSVGEYDETGSGPSEIAERRRLAGKVQPGYQCTSYDDTDSKFTTPYDWKYCVDMEVGQTYEVHWPHSAAGACGTVNQFQTPFYDGVFCNGELLVDTAAQIGVQGQVFIVVNDEDYFFPNMMGGMIIDGDMGANVAKYTGSTTGSSVNNELCSQYTPITWQVDRTCHMISASSFDNLCKDMLTQRDDMSDDLYPHGSRELVSDENAANNQN